MKTEAPPPVRIAARAGRRLGLDENGLGPRLGPMIVTAVAADLTEAAKERFFRPLPKRLASDLNDSKAIVSCRDVSIAEAWAQVLFEREQGRLPLTPRELLEWLCPESERELRQACPSSTLAQCWSVEGETLVVSAEQMRRVRGHIVTLAGRGIELGTVRSEIVCTGRLNHLKEEGIHRFAADLHCMERLILKERERCGHPVVAVCGKVGGIGKYEPFFGPLGDELRTVLDEGQACSGYHFPQVGQVHFVRDADAVDPLVMLASLLGKYLRELLMARIARFHAVSTDEATRQPSGYHDPVTTRFVEQTEERRRRLNIVRDCFERRPAPTRASARDRARA